MNNLSQTLPRELKIDNLTYVDFAEVFMIFRLDYFLLYLNIYIYNNVRLKNRNTENFNDSIFISFSLLTKKI